MSRSSAHRPDIDGLRAVAVGMVALWHAFPAALPGGFVGVDVFFVISGYLITGLISGAVDSERFSLATFYLRRARRILPALALVLAASWTAGLLTLGSGAFRRLGAHVLAGATFSSNLLLWSEAGYFDLSAAHKPLLHLWSLAVEEQFYLVWPVLLILASRAGARRPMVAALGLASLLASGALVYTHPTAAFYLLPTRGWELLAGAWLAESGPTRPRPVLSALALVTLALAGLGLHEGLRFPGLWALLPVVATSTLLAHVEGTPVARLLAWRPVEALGRVSYPLYLWHWPWLTLPAMALQRELSAAERAGALVVSLLWAIATYAWVEQPIRGRVSAAEGSARGRRLAAALLVAPLVVLGALGNLARLARVETEAQTRARQIEAPTLRPWVVDGRVVWDTNGAWSETLADRACALGPGGRRVVFVGDSTLQSTGAGADANFVVALRALLPDTWCVHNLAQAGFLAEQKAEIAQAELRRGGVDVLVWGVWGERALPDDPQGPHGGPAPREVEARPDAASALPVPGAVAAAWSQVASAFDAAVQRALGVAPLTDVIPSFEATRVEAKAHGADLILAVLPELERPFGEPSPVVDDVKRDVRAWADARGVPVVDLGQRWAGKVDVGEVRLDLCCHYNARGHRALAELFHEVLTERAPTP